MQKRPSVAYIQTFQDDKKSFDIPSYMKFVEAKIQIIEDEPAEKEESEDVKPGKKEKKRGGCRVIDGVLTF